MQYLGGIKPGCHILGMRSGRRQFREGKKPGKGSLPGQIALGSVLIQSKLLWLLPWAKANCVGPKQIALAFALGQGKMPWLLLWAKANCRGLCLLFGREKRSKGMMSRIRAGAEARCEGKWTCPFGIWRQNVRPLSVYHRSCRNHA